MTDCPEDTITLQRGTDLNLTGVLENEDGTPIDLTGHSLALRQHSSLAAVITVTDAATGAVEVTAEYSDQWPTGRIMHFRVVDSIDGRDTGYPQVWVQIE